MKAIRENCEKAILLEKSEITEYDNKETIIQWYLKKNI